MRQTALLRTYEPPRLKEQSTWQMSTGISLPIGSVGFDPDFQTEIGDFLNDGRGE